MIRSIPLVRLLSIPLIALLALVACNAAGGAGRDGGAGGDDLALEVIPADLASDRAGSLVFDVTDDETGRELPSRVLISPIARTPELHFDRNTRGELTGGLVGTDVAPGVIGAPEGILLVTGSGQITVAAGQYDVFVFHGPEWEADTRRVTVAAGEIVVVKSRLLRSVDTTGWMAADLHVHTMQSFDSQLQRDSRVVSEVTVGVELIVTTDHNVFTDLSPEVEMLGYRDLARAIVGDEFNFVEGHGGSYPMPFDPTLPANGVDRLQLDWEHVRGIHGGDIFRILHDLPTHPAVTVNHPRLLPDLGYFTNLRWNPPMPLADAGKFDALEVLSGYMQAPEDLSSLLRDWFFLLNTGVRVAGLGSSDTHNLRDVRAGFPRSWLRVPANRPADVTGDDVAAAVRNGRVLASNGPWAVLTVDGRQAGDVVRNAGGTVTVELVVDAPGWIGVDKARVFVNGRLAAERATTTGKRPLLRDRFELPLPGGDSWIVLLVGGPTPMRTAVVGEHGAGRVRPFAITSPVYIDGDGDGTWKPAFARLEDADPGPISPLGLPLQDRDPLGAALDLLDLRPIRETPRDCEPPPWMEPSTWADP